MSTTPVAAPKHLILRPPTNIEDYCADLMEIAAAQKLFRFSKSEFYRFRDHHRIESLPGNRVHLLDIVGAFEVERGVTQSARVDLDVRVYASLLLKREEVEAKLGLSRRTSCRFRTKHEVPTLSGGFVHTHDLVAAMDAERLGKRTV